MARLSPFKPVPYFKLIALHKTSLFLVLGILLFEMSFRVGSTNVYISPYALSLLSDLIAKSLWPPFPQLVENRLSTLVFCNKAFKLNNLHRSLKVLLLLLKLDVAITLL